MVQGTALAMGLSLNQIGVLLALLDAMQLQPPRERLPLREDLLGVIGDELPQRAAILVRDRTCSSTSFAAPIPAPCRSCSGHAETTANPSV